MTRRPISAKAAERASAPAASKKKPETVDLHVARKVKDFREGRMTQEQLATHLGITFQQIQKYERGANRISVGRFYEIAKALHMPMPSFFEGLDGESGALNGFAETDQAPYEAGPDRKEAELVAAFRAIADDNVRRSVMDLVAALARKDAAEGHEAVGAGRGRKTFP